MIKYGSRKFIITALVVLLTTMLAMLEKLDPSVGIIFAAAIASYNVVNGWVENGRKEE